MVLRKVYSQKYLSDIFYVEFKERLDLSHKLRLVDRNNNKILLPIEALPKIDILKETLKLHSVTIVEKNLIKELEAWDFELP